MTRRDIYKTQDEIIVVTAACAASSRWNAISERVGKENREAIWFEPLRGCHLHPSPSEKSIHLANIVALTEGESSSYHFCPDQARHLQDTGRDNSCYRGTRGVFDVERDLRARWEKESRSD